MTRPADPVRAHDDSYRVLVTGSREFTNYGAVSVQLGLVLRHLIASSRVLDAPVVVVHGAARGADSLADKAAKAFGMMTEPHPARWDLHGKRAGFLRNEEMVARGAALCLAFYMEGAGNRGTDHCVRLAEKAGIPVRRVTGAAS